MRDAEAATILLGWYDRHARVLPWRVSPADRAAGIRPDPYRVWLSEIMLQQTTVAAVREPFARFVGRWPDVAALAAAADADLMGEWAGLGYYARARRLLACARAVVSDHGGLFPHTRDGLLALPGVGPYTAAAIASIAFDQPVAVLDGNVERVMARLFHVETPLPAAKPALLRHAEALTPALRPGDYAQAAMDLGATICTPRNPACGICPWSGRCAAHALGIQASLPRKLPKAAKPTRHGQVWIARRSDGAWLLETRPESGLLGGMQGWPGTDWDGAGGAAPVEADWSQAEGVVAHAFTHFHLRLAVLVAEVAPGTEARRGSFVPAEAFEPARLPTVMRKALDLASDRFRAR